MRATRARRDGPAAASEPGRDEPGRAGVASPGGRVDGDHARDDGGSVGSEGGAHWASPDKIPARRLETMALAGELRIPFTSGILIGIGETRAERLDALLALRALADEFGLLQEVIVQNFRAKPGTRMASHPEPSLEEHLWTIAAARILLGSRAHVQAPPNLAYDDFPCLLDAGIDDWGGVSPVTIDHVNPEAPWPEVERLAAATRSRGLELAPACPSTPSTSARSGWTRTSAARAPRRRRDGPAREDDWAPGEPQAAVRGPSRRGPARAGRRGPGRGRAHAPVRDAWARAGAGSRSGRSAPPRDVRRRGDVRRHAEHPVHERLLLPLRLLRLLEGQAGREPPRRAVSRPSRGDRAPQPPRPGSAERPRSASRAASTRPSRGSTTRTSSETIASAVPGIHVHAFSALEVWQGAATLGLSLDRVPRPLARPRARLAPGHGSRGPRRRGTRCDLPGQGDDRAVARGARRSARRRAALERDADVRARRHAAEAGRGTSCGRASSSSEEAASPSSSRCPFVPMEAPIYLQGRARRGPTFAGGAARARGRAAGAPPGDHEHPGLLGQARARRDAAGARRRRQRPRRHADERVDLALRGPSSGRRCRPSGWRS